MCRLCIVVFCFCVSLILVVCSPADAQQLPPFFANNDSDGDGVVTKDEFKGPPQRFRTIDANGDGRVDIEEFKTFQAKARGAGPRTAGGGKPFLNEEQLRLLMTGTEISHVSPRSNSNVRLEFREGGVAGGVIGTSTLITGRWWITEKGTICFAVQQLGDDLCFFLVKNGDRLKRYNPRKEPQKGEDWIIVSPGPQAHLVP